MTNSHICYQPPLFHKTNSLTSVFSAYMGWSCCSFFSVLLKSEAHFITNQVNPLNTSHYRSGKDTMAVNAKIYHSRLAISHCVLYTSCQPLIYGIQNMLLMCQEVEWSSTNQKVDGSAPEPRGVLGHDTKSHILWGVCEWFHTLCGSLCHYY